MGFSSPDRSRYRHGVAEGGPLLQREVANFRHEVVTHADRSHRNHFLQRVVDQADPDHPEAALVRGNPAGFAEQLITVTHAHDERIDSAQHGMHAIKMDDAVFSLLAISHVTHHGHDRPAAVCALRVTPQFDPHILAIPVMPQDFQRALHRHRCRSDCRRSSQVPAVRC